MKALILKDITTGKISIFLSVVISVAVGVLGIYNGFPIIISVLCAMMPLILTSIFFGYDEKSNFEQFAFSIPISKKDYVLSKFFFTFIYAIVGSISIIILMIINKNISLEIAILFSTLTFTSTLIISSVQLPFILKYGAQYGRLIMVITNFSFFFIASALKEYGEMFKNMFLIFIKIPYSVMSLIIFLTGVAVLLLSILICIKIMNNKEY